MSIKEYQENGKTFYEVYVHVKSTVNPLIRVQKRKRNILSNKDAVKDESKMTKEALIELGALEQKGNTWERILELWYYEQSREKVNPDYTNKFTVNDYYSMLRTYTKPWFKLRPQDLSRGDAKSLISEVQQLGKSKSYVLKIKNTINLVFQWAIDNKKVNGITVNPFHGLKLEKKVDTIPEILNLIEIKTFIFEAKRRSHEWYHIWAMALFTGMRSGELYALEWTNVDLENKLIRVTKSFNKRTLEFKDTKSSYWRNVPISPELHVILVELKVITGNDQYVLPRIEDWYRGEQAKVLRAFMKGINLPSIKFHTLRACFATHLLANGVEASKVMKIGGWKDLKTMQIYMRLAGVDERGATDTLNFLPSDEAIMGHVSTLFVS